MLFNLFSGWLGHHLEAAVLEVPIRLSEITVNDCGRVLCRSSEFQTYIVALRRLSADLASDSEKGGTGGHCQCYTSCK